MKIVDSIPEFISEIDVSENLKYIFVGNAAIIP